MEYQDQASRYMELLSRLILSDETRRLLDRVEAKLNSQGVDPLGFDIHFAHGLFAWFKYFYFRHFRVESSGQEHVPASGPAILVTNHSGVLPYDCSMVVVDLIYKMQPPRLARALISTFVDATPFLGITFHRLGQIPAIKKTFEEALKAGALVVVCPEGMKGVGKTVEQRYRLSTFNSYFISMALKYRAPLIPMCIVGAEENCYHFAKSIKLARWLKKKTGGYVRFPFFPFTQAWPWWGILGMLPLPTKYYITYGPEFDLTPYYGKENDHDTVWRLTHEVRERIQGMIDDKLASRPVNWGYYLGMLLTGGFMISAAHKGYMLVKGKYFQYEKEA